MAKPSIQDAFTSCVERGANRVIVSPFFLLPGRHWEQVCINHSSQMLEIIFISGPFLLFQFRYYGIIYISIIVFLQDIPSLTAEAAKQHPGVPYLITAPLGLHELLVVLF